MKYKSLYLDGFLYGKQSLRICMAGNQLKIIQEGRVITATRVEEGVN